MRLVLHRIQRLGRPRYLHTSLLPLLTLAVALVSIYDLYFTFEDFVALQGEEAFLARLRRLGIVGLALLGGVVGAAPVQLATGVAWSLDIL